jgi:hypothetical protein
MGYDSFLASVIQPMVPYNQGMHAAGAGMSDLADFIAKQKAGEDDDRLKMAQLAQQAQIAQGQQNIGMLNATNTGRYHDEQNQLRQDQLTAKAEQEKALRVNHLRDMQAVARKTGDVATQQAVDSELKRMGWQVNESDSQFQPPPPGMSPGGLPPAAPQAPPQQALQVPEQDMTAPQDLGDVEDPSFLKAQAPRLTEEPGLASPEEQAAAQALHQPGGLPPAPSGPNPLLAKLSPEGQAQLLATSQKLGISPDAMLKMMQQESGMDPHRQGSGTSGLWQLQNKQAEAALGGRHLGDLTDAEQIAHYEKYTAGRPIHSDVDLMINQLAPARLGKIDTRDPNAVLYTAEDTAKWKPEQRAINGSLLNPDGSMTVGSASKGYLHGDVSPGAAAAPPGLSPGGLPPATTPQRKGGRFEYRDDKGNMVDTYDGPAEDNRVKSVLRDALSPMMGDGTDPRAKKAADKAVELGSRAFGTMGAEGAMKMATDFYEKEMGRKVTGAGGDLKDTREERLRLQGVGHDTRAVVDQVSKNEKYATIPTAESSLNTMQGLLEEGKRTGFGDKIALGTATRTLYGANQSNAEFTRNVDANGIFSRIERGLNTITDGGKLPDGLMNDLRDFAVMNKRELERRREEAARAAESMVDGSMLTATDAERSHARRAARNAFTHEFGNDDAGPAPASPATASAPTTGSQVAGAADDATKAALDRARKLLGR